MDSKAGSQSTEQLHYKSEGSDNKIPLILSILALLIAVIGVVIAAVGLARSGESSVVINGVGESNTAGGSNAAAINTNGDNKIWLFHHGPYGANSGYLDEATGQVKGYDVDVINAVCRVAGKNCKFVEDSWNNCWDSTAGQSQRPGSGLMAGYYDACAAWLQTLERHRAFDFSVPFSEEPTDVVFAVKTGNPGNFDHRDISGKVIGFGDGWVYDENCVARDPNIGGAPIATENIRHYVDEDSLRAAILDGSIDAAFGTDVIFESFDGIELIDGHATNCDIGGRSMMTRKDSTLSQWWNPAFEALLKSPEYHIICQDLLEQHGHLPGWGTEICIKT